MKKSKADGLCGESGIDRDSVWIGVFQDCAVSFPGNNWFHYEGSRKCSLYRSSVFLVSGITIILILLGTHSSYGVHMSIAIAVSFACCLPVTIWAKKIPAIGSLMMPRTMAYALMITMGLKML